MATQYVRNMLILWRKRGDDCFEARITTQRVKKRIKPKFAVVSFAGFAEDGKQLLDGQIFLAGLSIDHSQVHQQKRTVDRILLDRKQFDRTATFLDRVIFTVEHRINHSEDGQRRSVLGPLLYAALDFDTGTHEGVVS